MATVSAPDASEVVAETGLSELIQGTSNATFLAQLTKKIMVAEAETAVAIGEARYDGDGWTLRKALLLKKAVAYRTAAACLNVAWLQYATGTQEPLLMDPDSLNETRQLFTEEAQRLEELATAETETSTAETPFAMPSFGASTFTVTTGDRSPSQRNALGDERDDISASDTERG